MQPIMKMLYKIEGECSDEKPEVVDSSIDEFSRLKTKVALQMQTIRQKIKDRESLRPADYACVKLSSDIRTDLAKVKSDADRMRALQVMQARLKPKERSFLFGLIKIKDKTVVEVKDDVDHRAEIVELVHKHITEVERLSQKYTLSFKSSTGVSDVLAEDSNIGMHELLNESVKNLTGIDTKRNINNLTSTLDRTFASQGTTNVNVEEGLKKIVRVNDQHDQEIAGLSKEVNELKEIGNSLGEELKLQTAVVLELTAELDMELRQIEDLNSKLKDTLETAKKNNHILLDVFMVLVIVALIAYIYSLQQDKKICAQILKGSPTPTPKPGAKASATPAVACKGVKTSATPSASATAKASVRPLLRMLRGGRQAE